MVEPKKIANAIGKAVRNKVAAAMTTTSIKAGRFHRVAGAIAIIAPSSSPKHTIPGSHPLLKYLVNALFRRIPGL